MTTLKLLKKTTHNLFVRTLVIAICFVLAFTFIPFIDNEGTTASAATSIKIGDYVQMGTYYGEPILWRCVDIDENGPLMLSDKILCLKAFDAGGTVTTGSHGRGCNDGGFRREYGSNCWEDSNIRCWLNSTASAGNVRWTCGNKPDESHVWYKYNEYDTEAGFLTNFTQGEINCMKSVSQYQLLDNQEYDDMSSYGSTFHTCTYDIEDCVTNFEGAYKKKITDTMFLLDVKQVNKVYQNGEELGDSNYYRGKPTAECVANSEYKSSYLAEENYWNYWLRSPSANGTGNIVRYVYSGGDVEDRLACHGYYGVRPAFYLNLSSTTFKSGSGTEGSPYTVKAGGTFGTNNSLSWEYDESTKTLTISGEGEMPGWCEHPWNALEDVMEKLVIKEGITSVGEQDFWGCSSLKSITFPSTMNRIDEEAFYGCKSLTTLSALNMEYIGTAAFEGCSSLSSITSLNAKYIGAGAFSNCALTSVTIGKDVETISGGAFAYSKIGDSGFKVNSENKNFKVVSGVLFSADMKNLVAFPYGSTKTSYTIPSGVENISYYAFYGCEKLQSIYFCEGVKSIGYAACSGCKSLSTISFRSGELKIGGSAFSYCTNLTSVSLPEGLQSIDYHAFFNCSNLKSVNFQTGLKEIGSRAFYNCSLTKVDLKEGVEEIKSNAFEYNTNLSSISLPGGIENLGSDIFRNTAYYNTSTNWENNLLYYNEYLLSAKSDLSGDVTVKDGTTVMANSLFYGNEQIKGVNLPEGIKSIPESCFSGCSSLESVAIPESVKSIDNYAFYKCKKLEEIILNEGLGKIGNSAFEDCELIDNIDIPKTVKNIASYAFSDCKSLLEIVIPESVEYIGNSVFRNCISISKIVYCPENCDVYVYKYGNSAFYNAGSATDGIELEISDSVETIPEGLFSKEGDKICLKISSLTIGKNVKTIGNHAFGNITGFSSLTIPSSIENIEDNAFSGCTDLKDVFFNGNAPETSENSFGDNTQMGNTTIHIGTAFESAFNTEYWNKFKKAITMTKGSSGENADWYLNDGVLTITGSGELYDYSDEGASWFEEYGQEINEVYVYGVSRIGNYAFCNMDNLKSVTIDETVKSIGAFAFSNCDKLEKVTIPNSVIKVENFAFYECPKLKTVICGSGINSLGTGAFYNCSALENIYFLGGYPSMAKKCLTGCSENMVIHYPEDMTSWSGKTVENYTMEPMEISSISVERLPVEREYQQGSALDPTGLKLLVAYDTGDESIAYEASVNSGYETEYDFTQVGTRPVEVTYRGKTTSFDVEVEEPTVDSISIKKLPDIVEYEVGEELNTNGMVLTAKYSNGTEKNISEGYTTSYSFDTEGKAIVTVTYEEKETTFEVEVFQTNLTGIEIQSKPAKLSYSLNEQLSIEGMVVKGLYSNGLSETISNDKCNLSYDFSKPGKKSVKVEYGGYSAEYEVEVEGSDWPVITVNPGTASAGNTLTVDVDFNANETELGAYTFYLLYDTSVLTFKSIEGGAEGTYRSNYNKSGNLLGQKIVYMGDSALNEDGKLFTMTFDVKEDAETADLPITLEYEKTGTTDKQGNELSLFVVNGEAKILSYVPGDGNGDSEVSIADAVLLLRSISNLDTLTDKQKIALDVNGDGEVTITDAIVILASLVDVEME